MYFKHTSRTSFGFRVQGQYISVFTGRSDLLPITEKLYLGGEYSIRGLRHPDDRPAGRSTSSRRRTTA